MNAFLQFIGMTPTLGSGTTLPSVRDGQRRPTFAQPRNVPCSIVSKGGSFMVVREYTQPVLGLERGTGTLGTATVPVPFTNADIGAGAGVVGNWTSSYKGTGIDVSAAGESRWYYLGWVTEGVVQDVDITVQPIGRSMELLFDYTANRETVIAQSPEKRIVTLTVPNLSGSAPGVPGVTTMFLAVFVRYERQAGDEWNLTNPAFYLGTVAATGGTVVDSYSREELRARGGWYPSSFLNVYSARAACVSGQSYVLVGGAESFEGMADFSSDALVSLPNFDSVPSIPRVATHAGNLQRISLLAGTSATAVPNDARVCRILKVSGTIGFSPCNITVEAFHPYKVGDRIAIEGVGGTTNVNSLTTLSVSSVVDSQTFSVNVVYNAAYTGGGYVAGRNFVPPEGASLVDDPLTWPRWVAGKRIAIEAAGRQNLRIRRLITDASGNRTIAELDKALSTAITPGVANSKFRVSGDTIYRRTHTDPRYCDKVPFFYQLDLEGPLGSPVVNGVIAAPDGSGDWCFSNTRGVKVRNIPTQISVTGVPGGQPSTALSVDPVSVDIGTCSPGSLFLGPDKCILGFDRRLGPWRLDGSTVTLLDPDRDLSSTYETLANFDGRGGSNIVGVTGADGLSPTIIEVADFAAGHALVDGQVVLLSGLTGGVNEEPLTANGVFYATVVSKTAFSVPAIFDASLPYTPGSGRLEVHANGGNQPLDMCVGFWNRENMTAYWLFPGKRTFLFYDFRVGVLARGEFAGQWPNAACIEELYAPYMFDLGARLAVADPKSVVGANPIVTFNGNNPRAVAPWGEMNPRLFGDLQVVGASDGSSTYGEVASADEIVVNCVSATFSSWNIGNTVVIVGTAPDSPNAMTIGSRVGSFKTIERGVGSQIETLTNYRWSGTPPLLGDIVSIGAILVLFETGEWRSDVPVKITGLQNPQFTVNSDSTESWTLFAAGIGGGTTYTVSDVFARSTVFTSDVLQLGRQNYVLNRGGTTRSIRLRLAWYAPTTGAVTLDQLTVAWTALEPKTTVIDEFMQAVERGDRADVHATADLNAARGPKRNSITARLGGRMLTLGNGATPIHGAGSGVLPTPIYDAIHLVLRTAGQPMVSVTSNPLVWGFLNGTTCVSPYLSLGSLNMANPPSLY